MFGCNLVGLLTIITVAFAATHIPTFPDTYHAKGIVRLPYAELKEPYEIWYDGPNKNSRIDWYGGMDKTYALGDSLQFKYYYYDGKKQCARLNGAGLQTILPDLTGYKYNGLHKVEGCKNKCHMLQSQTLNGQQNSTYRFYYEFDEAGNAIPRLFWWFGWDKLLGSHFDRYDITYEGFDKNISAGTFNITGSCTNGYPKKVHSELEKEFALNPLDHYMKKDSQRKIHKIFLHYKQKFSKQYSSRKEHSARFANFVKHLRFVHGKNRAGLSYELAINHLADLHDHELDLMSGGRKQKNEHNNDHIYDPDASWYDKTKFLESNVLPDSWDWRHYGAVTPVKDQAICGSCWSFGSAENLEGAFFKKHGYLVYLSQQQLVDCSWSYGNTGCDGGFYGNTFKYLTDFGGIQTELSYGPYLGQNGICHSNKSKIALSVTGYTRVPTQDNLALQSALVEIGPIGISINSATKSFYFYSRGVYDDTACKGDRNDLDHSPLLAGYGVLDGQPYWLVKNSWSNYWGDDGYVLVARNTDYICGVSTRPVYGIVD